MKTATLPSTSILDPANGSAVSRDSDGQSLRLTPRQLEVLALLCEGLPNKLICRRLSISAGTVKAHISGILRELGVASRLHTYRECDDARFCTAGDVSPHARAATHVNKCHHHGLLRR